MPWIITKDYLNNGKLDPLNREGVCSGDLSGHRKKLPDRFRLYDGDGNLYYEGRFDVNGEDCFDPLDWAKADSGCTTLKYQEHGKGKWEEL